MKTRSLPLPPIELLDLATGYQRSRTLFALVEFALPSLLARAPHAHRSLGWAYVASVVLLLVPGGIALIPFAKGGLAGQSGFLVQAVWLFAATFAGLRRVLARDFVGHRAWMIRSYAMASSALSFRVLFVALQALGLPRAYEMGIWASFGASV